MTAKLLPCPFCGSEPVESAYGYYHEGTESRDIRCTNKSCEVRPYLTLDQDEDQFDMVEAWNTRHDHHAFKRVTVSLIAAISLLESGGKKAAMSDKAFEQMIDSYKRAVDDARKALDAETITYATTTPDERTAHLPPVDLSELPEGPRDLGGFNCAGKYRWPKDD